MNTITTTLPQTGVAAPPATVTPAYRADVVVENKIAIPGWINTLAEYRRWAESDAYPQNGWVSYLDGTVWVNPSPEEFFTHNQTRLSFYGAIGGLLSRRPEGCLVPSGMLFVNEAANLATEPDGLYFMWDTVRNNKLRLVANADGTDYTQLEGAADLVLEVISDVSEFRDRKTLRELYWKARIPEFWLLDTRGRQPRFDILRHAPDGYQPAQVEDGWMRSEILGHLFRIERTTDPLGRPKFLVNVKAGVVK